MKMNKEELALDLIDFLYKSPSAYQAVATIKERLDEDGFVELKAISEKIEEMTRMMGGEGSLK